MYVFYGSLIAVGAASALSLSPWHQGYLFFVGVSIALLMGFHRYQSCPHSPKMPSVAALFFFAVGFHWVGFAWIFQSFIAMNDDLLMYIGSLLMPVIFAAFLALITAIVIKIILVIIHKIQDIILFFRSKRLGLVAHEKHGFILYAAAMCFGWLCMEWLRGYVLGFPWNLSGSIWAAYDVTLQFFDLVGLYGACVITMFMVVLFAVALYGILSVVGGYKNFNAINTIKGVSNHKIAAFSSFFALILIGGGIYLYGFVKIVDFAILYKKYQNHPYAEHFSNAVELIIVQPNITQKDKWNTRKFNQNNQILKALSQKIPTDNEEKKSRFIIWPEAAITRSFDHDIYMRQFASAFLKEGDSWLSGIVYQDYDDRIYNGCFLYGLSSDGPSQNQFDKKFLVPFGEYLPFQTLFSSMGIKPWTRFITPGNYPRKMSLPNDLSFSPLICYEIIFPGDVTEKEHEVDFLLNISNDGWYGNSAGPYQHLDMSRMRAIEENMWVVRAAYTGVSAIIDPKGHIVKKLDYGKRGTLGFDLDDLKVRYDGPTVFQQYGHMPAMFMSLCWFLFLLVAGGIASCCRKK